MNKTNNPPHKPSNGLRKNKILLGVFVPLGLLTFCGAGLGIGYAIWHKNTPTFSFSTTEPLLTNVGDTFSIQVTTNKSNVEYCVIQIDDTYTELFNGTDPCLKFVGSQYINVSSSQPTLRAASFNDKKAIFTIECVKELASDKDTQFISYQILHFNKKSETQPDYLHDGHFVFQTSTSHVDSDDINNYQFWFQSKWTSKPSLDDFLTWLGEEADFCSFLPIRPDSDKIAFGQDDDMPTVLDKLHSFDNAASMLAIIVSDDYNSLSASGANDANNYAIAGVNVFGLMATNSNKYAEETQKFDLAFRQRGGKATYNDEIVDDIFMSRDEAIGDDWQIHWDSWLRYGLNGGLGGSAYNWMDYNDVTGNFNGMKNSSTDDLERELKVIYKNVVKDNGWPSGW